LDKAQRGGSTRPPPAASRRIVNGGVLDAYSAPSRAGQPSYGQANVVCTLCHCAERET
jgi:hypothetical protein